MKPAPVKFWLSSLPADTPIERLVYLAKLRWLIEAPPLPPGQRPRGGAAQTMAAVRKAG